MIYNKPVYLDVDDIHVYDTTGTRVVCVVYVDYSPTQYLNVHEALIQEKHARYWDHDNELNPNTWSLYLPKLSSVSRLVLLGLSSVVSIIMTFLIYRAVWDLVKILTTIMYKFRVYTRRNRGN